MSVVFRPGQELGPEDLDINLTDSGGSPTNVAWIRYAIYYVDPTTGLEMLVGDPERVPINPMVGTYYAAVILPSNSPVGDYVLRWSIRQLVNSDVTTVVQEFGVVDDDTRIVSPYSDNVLALIRSFRIKTRDNNCARNYHFRPATGEGVLTQQTAVFAQIWEDEEIVEYLDDSLNLVNMYPPETCFSTLDQLVTQKRNWRSVLLEAAIFYGMRAVTANWIVDEFSVGEEVEVRVFLSDGTGHDLRIRDLFQVCHGRGPRDEVETRIRSDFDSGLLLTDTVESGNVRRNPVTDVMEHRTIHKPVVSVRTESGRVAATTVDHSLFLLARGTDIVPVMSGDLRPGDEVVVVDPSGINGDRVTAVLELRPRETTYDLRVPGPENFVLSNGMLAHNSYSIGGISLDLQKSSSYQSLAEMAMQNFKDMIEAAKRTVKIVKGLRQSRFGYGLRSALGPINRAGTQTPRNWVSFF